MADKAQTRKTVNLGMQTRVAMVRAASVDEEARTVELVWSTGAQVRRFSWSEGEFLEELSLDPKHVRMGRLENGAPLLNSHRSWGLDSVLGVVESAEIGKGEAAATVRFPAEGISEDADRVFRLVRDGIIRHVSVGYAVHRYEKTEEKGKTPIWRATDWEPYEISLVPMGADDAATVRAECADTNPCELVLAHRGADQMADTKKKSDPQGGAAPAASPAPAPETVEHTASQPAPPTAEEIRRQERARLSEIHRIADGFDLGEDFVSRANAENMTVDEARAAAFELHYQERREAPAEQIDNVAPAGQITGGEDLARAGASEGIRSALAHRFNPSRNELSEAGRNFYGMRLMEMARAHLEAHGFRVRGLAPAELARVAMGLSTRGSGGLHSTSDFPYILADLAGKELRSDYEGAPETFTAWTSRGTIPDFKEIKINQLGDFPALEKVLEGGEYQFGTIGEAREAMKLSKYGKRIAFTWEMLMNDDLNAFMMLAGRIGYAVRTLESDLVYDHFLSNPDMGDGDPCFHANHGNSGAGTISTANLGARRAAMRKQTGLGGDRKLNIMAKNLLVPAALETVAEQNVSEVQATEVANKNVFAGKLRPIAEPRLDDVSEVEWYMTADPAQVETLRVCRLEGEDGPVVESRTGFDVDGLEIKVRHVMAVKLIDWRGLQKSDGVDPE